MAKRPSIKSNQVRKAYEFFRKEGLGASAALALARAEVVAENLGWTYRWEYDEEPWEDLIGDVPIEDVKEVLVVLLLGEDGEALQSVGGVIDPDASAARYEEANLALEELSQRGLL